MKTLKNSLLVIAGILLVSLSSFAKDKNKVKSSLAFSVENYVESLQFGYNENLDEILSENVKININRNGRILTYGKDAALKANTKTNIVQNCEIKHDIITESDVYAIVNIKMKYDHFTRDNIVSLNKINGKWQITEINAVFK